MCDWPSGVDRSETDEIGVGSVRAAWSHLGSEALVLVSVMISYPIGSDRPMSGWASRVRALDPGHDRDVEVVSGSAALVVEAVPLEEHDARFNAGDAAGRAVLAHPLDPSVTDVRWLGFLRTRWRARPLWWMR